MEYAGGKMRSKLFLFLVVMMLLVGVVCAASDKNNDKISDKKIEDTTNESYKKVTDVPSKWKDKVQVTDKSTDIGMYKVEDYKGNIKISKKENNKISKVKVKIPEKTIKELPGYDGKEFAVLHIADDGSVSYREVKTKDVKVGTDVVFETEMSTTIVGGATGYWIKNFSQSLFDTTMNIHGEGVTAVTVNITNPPAYTNILDYVPGNNDSMPISNGVAWWRFDEASGSTIYDDIGSNDLTISGTVSRQTEFPGMFNKSVYIGHTSTPYMVGSTMTNISRTHDFTIVAWINSSDTANNTLTKKILTTGQSTSDRVTFAIRNGQLVAGVYNGASYLYRQQIDIEDNTNYFVAAVYDWTGSSGSFKLYANDLSDLSSSVSISSDYSGTYIKSMDTHQDNVIVFDRALTEQEVMNLRRGFSGIRAYTYPGGNMTPIQSGSQTLTSADSLDSIKFNSSYSNSYSGSIVEYFQQDYTLINEYDNDTHHKVDMIYTPQSNVTAGELVYELSSIDGLGEPVLTSNQTGATVSLEGNNLTVHIGSMAADTSKYFNVAMEILTNPQQLRVEDWDLNNDAHIASIYLYNSQVNDTWDISLHEMLPGYNYTISYTNGTSITTQYADSTDVALHLTSLVGNYNLILSREYIDNIVDYTPVSNSLSILVGSGQEFWVQLLNTDATHWKINGSEVQLNESINEASYVFNESAGIYNLTVETAGDSQTWIVTVEQPRIEGYIPDSLTPVIGVGDERLFSVGLSLPDDVEWLVDGVVQNSSLNSTSSVYIFSSEFDTNYNVTARTTYDQVSWNLTVLPLSIESWTPTNMTLNTKNGTPLNLNLSLVGVGMVQWLVNGEVRDTDVNVNVSSYVFVDSGIGEYNVTGRIDGYQKTWNVTVLPRTIDSWYPIEDSVSVTEGGVIQLNVTCSDPSTVWWYVDGELAQTNTSSIYAGFSYEDEVGLHQVNATIDDDVHSWYVDVVHKSIVGFSPSDTTPSTPITDSVDLWVNMDGLDNIYWYIDGVEVDSDINVTGSNYTFYKGISGYYNVTAESTYDSQTWIVHVLSNNFIDFNPSEYEASWSENTSQEFNVTLQANGTVDWLLNGELVQSNSSSSQASYILDEKAGSYNVTARVDEDQIEWLATITESRWKHWMKWDGSTFDWYYRNPDDSQYDRDIEVGA